MIELRFEAEIENYSSMENVLAKLDMRTIKLSGNITYPCSLFLVRYRFYFKLNL